MADFVPSNRGKRLPGEVYSPAEVRALIEACGRSSSGMRNAAIIAVLYGAGLRAAEALALKPADLDLQKGSIRVRSGKGGKFRVAGIAPDCQGILERWLECRKGLGFNGREPVFCGITKGGKVSAWGTPIKTIYLRTMLPRLGKKAGLDKRIHAHGFRHSAATALLESGSFGLRGISQQLGHSSTAVTDHYLQRLSGSEVVAVMRSTKVLG